MANNENPSIDNGICVTPDAVPEGDFRMRRVAWTRPRVVCFTDTRDTRGKAWTSIFETTWSPSFGPS